MNYISQIIIPVIVLIVIGYGLYKKIDIYGSFIKGVEEGVKTGIRLFPMILAMILGVNIFIKSNIINDLASCIDPYLRRIGINSEIMPLIMLRPVSGSSSLIIMDSIIKEYGPDSYIGKLVSVIQGSTDTTIYIISLYFGSVGVKKIRYSLVVGLIIDFICVVIAIMVVRMWG